MLAINCVVDICDNSLQQPVQLSELGLIGFSVNLHDSLCHIMKL